MPKHCIVRRKLQRRRGISMPAMPDQRIDGLNQCGKLSRVRRNLRTPPMPPRDEDATLELSIRSGWASDGAHLSVDGGARCGG